MKRAILMTGLVLLFFTGCATTPIPGGVLITPDTQFWGQLLGVGADSNSTPSTQAPWETMGGKKATAPTPPPQPMSCKQQFDTRMSYVSRVYAAKKAELSQFLKDTGDQAKFGQLSGTLELWYPAQKTEAQNQYAECLSK